ncbi:MAG TPA: lipase maturation factor family protein [Vicinamibacterales bacterium]|nr:lipase maturation factor family protein [Vicinamibacterales bacterium]
MNGYWYSRLLFERALALIYIVGFLVAANQFVPLLGEHGLEPVSRFVRLIPFRASPSLFFFAPTDTAFRVGAWAGVALSLVALAGLTDRAHLLVAAMLWAAMWLLYLSFVNVGQTFYGFGWETLLLESGFLAIFLGSGATAPGPWLNWAYRWLLFRVMFGAGLIKLRGDPCWRDLTCLNYYFETQPMPNPVSWYFHWLPPSVHRAGVVFNHVAELGVPFAYFAPQPIASIAGLVTIIFQLVLIVSGNLSWLNWLTIVLCIPTLDDRFLSWLPVSMPALHEPQLAQRLVAYAVVSLVAILSIAPLRNMLSPAQIMNTSFDPLHIVNTYGAFGSITRERNEVVIEGTDADSITPSTAWREYEFKGKPGDVARVPRQFAPYHLRLDWLMWFAAFSTPDEHRWFPALLVRLLEGNRDVLSLLRTNPFPDRPPRYVRAQYYRYRFTSPDERRQTGRIWNRELIGAYFAPASLKPQVTGAR